MPLEAIQEIRIRSGIRGYSLVVSTESGEQVIARHPEAGPLLVVQLPLEKRTKAMRIAALEEGQSPDDLVVIPKMLEVLRHPGS